MTLTRTIPAVALPLPEPPRPPGSPQPEAFTAMNNPEYRITRIALAATDAATAAAFYENVFDCALKPFDMPGDKIYAGMLLGYQFVIAPNSIANVTAERSRIQFNIATSDLDATLERVTSAGGTVREVEPSGNERVATVLDPDDNTIIFVGA